MFDEFGLEYFVTVVLWVAVLVILFGRAWTGRQPVVGLALAYWVNLAIIHLLAGLLPLLPWHYSRDRAYTLGGFTLTGYAMAGFLLGQFIPRLRAMLPLAPLTPTPLPLGERGRGEGAARGPVVSVDPSWPWLAWILIWCGVVFYFVTIGLIAMIPGFTALLSNGLNVSVAGFCLLWWSYYKMGYRGTAWLMVAWVLILPAMTVILDGFLGFGICAMLTVAAFVAVKYAPRRTIVLGGIALGFVGLSLFTTYMAVRTQIRAAVWGGETLADRFLATSSLENEWTWADLGSSTHLAAIENRLNQNALVGAARYNIESRKTRLAGGETIRNAFIALVPRLVWPGKPEFAGSGRLVSRFTGIQFESDTSVGIGHVMELYINFGPIGVIVGFTLIGFVLSLVDERAGQHLHFGNIEGFLVWFVAGQTLLTVGGNFAESFAAAVGAVILCLLLSRTILAGWTGQPLLPSLREH